MPSSKPRVAKRKTTPAPTGEAVAKARAIEKITQLCAGLPAGSTAAEAAPLAEPAPRPMSESEYRNWRKRTLAELISLPAICPVRRCRRQRRCCVEEPVCLTIHRTRAAERVNLMLGWEVAALFPEEEDDLSW